MQSQYFSKILIVFICFVLTACVTTSSSKFTQEQNEASIVASALFRDVCFGYYARPEERVKYLDSTYSRKTEVAQKNILKYLGLDKGTAWGAYFSKEANFYIVLDNYSNCNLLAFNVNPKIMHNSFDMLYELLSTKDKALPYHADFANYHFAYLPAYMMKDKATSKIVIRGEDGVPFMDAKSYSYKREKDGEVNQNSLLSLVRRR